MDYFDSNFAAKTAAELVGKALEAGMIEPVKAWAQGDPAKAGEATGKYIAAMVKQIATDLQR